MWNSVAELVKKAKGIADLKYPNGYNKEQLIACSKEVYDGRTGGAFDAYEDAIKIIKLEVK